MHLDQPVSFVVHQCVLRKNYSIFLSTSMEQPINDPSSNVVNINCNKFGGAAFKSKNSVRPPVKSSSASEVVPPFNASYEPCNLIRFAISKMKTFQ